MYYMAFLPEPNDQSCFPGRKRSVPGSGDRCFGSEACAFTSGPPVAQRIRRRNTASVESFWEVLRWKHRKASQKTSLRSNCPTRMLGWVSSGASPETITHLLFTLLTMCKLSFGVSQLITPSFPGMGLGLSSLPRSFAHFCTWKQGMNSSGSVHHPRCDA